MAATAQRFVADGSKQTMCLIGDSITNSNVNASASNSYDAIGYWTWAQIIMGHRFGLLNNSGSTGRTTTQMLALVTSDVVAYSPGWCLVEGGGNDIVTGVSTATITANLQSIYDQVRGSGIRLVATTVLPSTSIDTTSEKTILYAVNDWIRAYARANPSVVLCDWFSDQANPTTGDPATNYTSDGVHPAPLGAYWLGKRLAAVLSPLTFEAHLLPYSNARPNTIIPNPMMVGNTAGLADSVTFQTLVAVAPTATKSKVTRTDGVNGDWQQINCSAASDGWQVQQVNTNVGVDWSVGDTVYGICEFETDTGGTVVAGTGHYPMRLEVLFYSGTGTVYDAFHNSSTAINTNIPTSGILRTPNMVVPASTTRLYLRFQSWVTGANVRIGRNQIVKV